MFKILQALVLDFPYIRVQFFPENFIRQEENILQTNVSKILKSTFFSALSLSRCIDIGHRQSRPVDECSEEKKEGLGREKIHTGRDFMADERENARGRNIRCCIYTTTLRKIDRMALFIPSHLLLYVRG